MAEVKKDDYGFAVTRKTKKGITRHPQVVWDPRHDVVMVPVLLACEDEYWYGEACVWACRHFQHPPKFSENYRPTDAEKKQGCENIVHERTVTQHLSCFHKNSVLRADYRRTLRTVYTGRRTGRPLTWAEKKMFLQPYRRKKVSPRVMIDEGSLLVYLDRGEEDKAAVKAYLESLPSAEIMPKDGCPVAPGNARPPLSQSLNDAVDAFTGTPLTDLPGLLRAWLGIHAVLGT